MVVAAMVLSTGSGAAEGRVKSKIGIHLLGRYTPGAKKVIESECPVIKILGTHSAMMRALEDYKTRHPKGIVVLRIYTPIRYSISQNPAVCARDFWDRVLEPEVSKLSEQQKGWIDYLEGPNECDTTPCWGNVGEANWYSAFSVALVELISEHGFKPCVGNIPVGNPPGSADDIEAKIRAYIPAVRAAKEAGGCWSYHAYTCLYTKDLGTESFYSLRYRRFYDIFKKHAPDLVDMPMVITEGGVDSDGRNHIAYPGWKRDSADRFMDWLSWFDSEIQKDSYIKGITLFQIGDPGGWDSFDLEPIAERLAEYLR